MGLIIAKYHAGKCFEPGMTQQSDLIAIINFLDSKLCADLTNVIVQFIGNGDSIFVFDGAFKDVESNTRQTRCTEVHNRGSHIAFYGLLDDGEHFFECYVMWSKDCVEVGTEYMSMCIAEDPTSKKERKVLMDAIQTFDHGRVWRFTDRYSVQRNIANQTKNQRFTVRVLDNDETNSFIISDVEDIGAKLHALLPFRFRTCETMSREEQKMI